MNMLSNRKPYIDLALLLCLTLLLAQTASAQTSTKFGGRTWSEFTGGAKAVCADNDIDNDNDGLIELCYLEDVNAIRHNLEGTSYKSSIMASGSVTGCGGGDSNDKCFGYELVRDLDFKDDDSYRVPSDNKDNWTTGESWEEIGYFRYLFNSIFEGNGHTISNLMINKPNTDDVGLFGKTSDSSKISNIGLLNVSIKAGNDIGGLVGDSSGSIANSYVTGSVEGKEFIGGLVGTSQRGSSIANSYATGSVAGRDIVGGLIGQSVGSITDSYATGSVFGRRSIVGVGGLIGWNVADTENSYATGSVKGTSALGGLVGFINAGSITNSYWDTQTSGRSTSAGGSDDDGKTTDDLQSPTTATGIYSMWSTDNWDFGTSSQYPRLKYGRGGDADNLACGTSQQPACGALLGRQKNNQPVIASPTINTEILIKGNVGTIKTIPVTVSDVDVDDKLTLLLSAEDEGQNLVVLGTTKAEVLPNGNADRGINEDLRIRIPQTIIFGMTKLQLVAEDDSGFGNAMSEPVLFKVRVVANTPPTIESIPSPITLPLGTTLNVVIKDEDGDPLSVQLDSSDSTVATATIVATDNANYTLTITGSSAGTAVITVTASDDKGGGAEAMFTILVDAEPSGTVSIAFNAINANTWRLTATNNVMDANDIAETNYQWFRNDTAIPGATANTYPIPNNNTGRDGGTEYKVEVTFVDNIGQSVTTSSNIYTVANQAPVINAISQTAVNEGGTVSINPTVNDANRDRLTYTWRVTSGDSTPSILENVPKTNRRIRFNVPADWVDNPSTATGVTETLYLEIKATETGSGGLSATRTAEVVVTKKNNGPSTTQPKIDRDEKILTLSTSTLESAIAKDPDGGDINNADVSYQWQRCQSSCSSLSSWMPISGRTGSTYTIPGNEPERNRFRIKIGYTDAQGYSETMFTNSQTANESADIRVRAKVFLEGALQ